MLATMNDTNTTTSLAEQPEEKEKHFLLERAYENDHILFFEHDKDIEACTVKKTAKGIEFDKVIQISDL